MEMENWPPNERHSIFGAFVESDDPRATACIPGGVSPLLASSLHDVYVFAGLLGMITLATVLLLPAALSPTHSAAAN
jgi:hypothetical protein